MAEKKDSAASSSDKSTTLKGGDVNSEPTRGTGTAPTPETIGPRSA
jgi:hypothetical protein